MFLLNQINSISKLSNNLLDGEDGQTWPEKHVARSQEDIDELLSKLRPDADLGSENMDSIMNKQEELEYYLKGDRDGIDFTPGYYKHN